mmetsp:Transcript_10586/g.24562  ORF Transcript_10586/g.24562 Transcript_10586/m.24562 type:complete len:555 (-) Transcript_10586:400-2064(-)
MSPTSRALGLALLAGWCEGSQRGGSQFVSSFSAQLQRLGDAQLSTLACLGPRKSGKGSLVGKLVGTAVADDCAEGVECVISEDGKLAVLNSAGFGEQLGGEPDEEGAAHDTALAVALAETVVHTVFFREFLADPADAVGRLAELRPAMGLLLRMSREPGAAVPRKRTLILIVRDFEPEAGVGAEQVRGKFVELLEEMWASLPAPATGRGGEAPALTLADVIDVQIAPLPLPKPDAAAFTAGVDALKTKLRAAASPSSAAPASQLLSSLALATKLAESSAVPDTSDVLADELAAALACARAANLALEEYADSSSELHSKALAREVTGPYGTLATESSEAIQAALKLYDEATAAHEGSAVCAKRRAVLLSALLADLRPLYSHALQVARIVGLNDFQRRSQNLTTGQLTNFRGDLQTALDAVVGEFRDVAAALCALEAFGLWSAGLEERMLTQELQQMSAEMVRRAQLHGLYQPAPERVPTGVALHWLHPNPFGKDMRNDQLGGSDQLAYSSRAKELLRSRPTRFSSSKSGLKLSSLGNGLKLTEEDLVVKAEKARK